MFCWVTHIMRNTDFKFAKKILLSSSYNNYDVQVVLENLTKSLISYKIIKEL